MPRKILIVDDNSINRQMLKNTLCREYDIIEAETGNQALELMRRNYKLLSAVLMDVVMPGMNGYEILSRIRENALLAQIPVIMVTGLDDEETRVRALSLGANDFILKPFNPDIVKHILRNNIALRETASLLNAIQRDKLTGLYNRETFFERAEAMIRDKAPGYYTLSGFDIDNFKMINDRVGSVEGDRILKEIGAALRNYMISIDGLSGRISSDNFVALFPTAKSDIKILDRVRQSKMFEHLHSPSLVFSIGRYVITDTSLPLPAAYDRACFAKLTVKGRVDSHVAYFDREMHERLMRNQEIIAGMEESLKSRQFEVWFQPQYNSTDDTLVEAVACARWLHPENGYIPCEDYIPLFEQSGFIYSLDQFVWREVCRYLRVWNNTGVSPVPVSVTISSFSLFQDDLIDVITGLLEEYEIPPELLHLGVAESVFEKSGDRSISVVQKLIDLGFVVEVNDFGSGATLKTFKYIPVQTARIDIRFSEADEVWQRGAIVLKSVIEMMKLLGVTVICSGIETRKQADFIKSIGCDRLSGNLFAPLMPASDFEWQLMNDKR